MGVNVETRYSTTLSAAITDTATDINVTTAPAFSTGYATIDLANSSKEDIKWQALAGTQMQTCLRGLSATATTDTEVSGNKKSHLISATIQGTTLHYIINNKADVDDNETITGKYTFQSTSTTGKMLQVVRNLTSTSTDDVVCYIYNQHASDDQSALLVDSAATAALALDVKSLATTANGAAQFRNEAGGANTNYVQLGLNATSAIGSNYFYRNLTSASTAQGVVLIIQDHAADDQPGLLVRNDATASHGVTIIGNMTSSPFAALEVRNDVISSTDTFVYLCASSAATTGSNYFYRNLGSANTAGPVVNIYDDHANDDQNALFIRSDATAATTLNVRGFSTTAGSTAVIENNESGVTTNQVSLASNKADTNGSNYFFRNLAAANTAGPVVHINNAHASDDQPSLYIEGSNPIDTVRIVRNVATTSQSTGCIDIATAMNSADPTTCISMNATNAGAGLEYAFAFGGSESGITAAGNAGFISNNLGTFTLVGFIRVWRGAERFIPYGTIA